jgi:Fis family transcriptional regulator, factor for inversion stimulation protein
MKELLEELVRRMWAGGILYREAIQEFQKSFILVALRENKWNRSKTASVLEVHRNTLMRLIRELQIEPEKPTRRRPPQSVPSLGRGIRRR